MSKLWESPIYKLRPLFGKEVIIDVTTSVSSGLPPNKLIREKIIPFLKERNANRILDFGAGALRHSIPLLKEGFEVCAVEFEEGFSRPTCKKALLKANRYSNFSKLIWPKDFLHDKRRFDAAIVFYVLQIMPIENERQRVIKSIYEKLKENSYLFYASRYGQITEQDKKYKISDGYYRNIKHIHRSFYKEYNTEETHNLFERYKFHRIRSLSERGTEQVLVYAKGKVFWA